MTRDEVDAALSFDPFYGSPLDCQVRIEGLAEDVYTGKLVPVAFTCLRPTPCDIHTEITEGHYSIGGDHGAK